MKNIYTKNWRYVGLLVAFSLSGLGLESAAADSGAAKKHDAYGDHSMRGNFAFSMDGSFSSAPPPFMGARENFAFSQAGLYYFDGHGGVSGEFSMAFENATSGGIFSTAMELGTYIVSHDGRMVIEFQDFRAGTLINEVTLDCVIVKKRQLARCVMVRLVSFQQGPQPVMLPVTGLGVFERQR